MVSGGNNVTGYGAQVLPQHIRLYIYLSGYWYTAGSVYYELEATFENKGYDSLKIPIGNNDQVADCTVTLMDAERNIIDTQVVSGTIGSASSGEVVFQNVPARFRLAFTVSVYNSGNTEGSGSRLGESYVGNILLYHSSQPENEYYIYRGANFLSMTANLITSSGNVTAGASIGTSSINLNLNLPSYWYTAGEAKFAFNTVFESNGYSSLRLSLANNSEIGFCTVNLLDEGGNLIESKQLSGAYSIADVNFHNIPSKFKLEFVVNVFNSGNSQNTGGRGRYHSNNRNCLV